MHDNELPNWLGYLRPNGGRHLEPTVRDGGPLQLPWLLIAERSYGGELQLPLPSATGPAWRCSLAAAKSGNKPFNEAVTGKDLTCRLATVFFGR